MLQKLNKSLLLPSSPQEFIATLQTIVAQDEQSDSSDFTNRLIRSTELLDIITSVETKAMIASLKKTSDLTLLDEIAFAIGNCLFPDHLVMGPGMISGQKLCTTSSVVDFINLCLLPSCKSSKSFVSVTRCICCILVRNPVAVQFFLQNEKSPDALVVHAFQKITGCREMNQLTVALTTIVEMKNAGGLKYFATDRIAKILARGNPEAMSEDSQVRLNGITRCLVENNPFLIPIFAQKELDSNVFRSTRYGGVTLQKPWLKSYLKIIGTKSGTELLAALAECRSGDAGTTIYQSYLIASVALEKIEEFLLRNSNVFDDERSEIGSDDRLNMSLMRRKISMWLHGFYSRREGALIFNSVLRDQVQDVVFFALCPQSSEKFPESNRVRASERDMERYEAFGFVWTLISTHMMPNHQITGFVTTTNNNNYNYQEGWTEGMIAVLFEKLSSVSISTITAQGLVMLWDALVIESFFSQPQNSIPAAAVTFFDSDRGAKVLDQAIARSNAESAANFPNALNAMMPFVSENIRETYYKTKPRICEMMNKMNAK